MRSATVGRGIRLITAGVGLIIIATYFSGAVADLFHLSEPAQYRLVFGGLVLGAILGCAGILTAIIGFLSGPRQTGKRGVGRGLLFLLFFVAMFFLLFFLREERTGPPRLRPGETITI